MVSIGSSGGSRGVEGRRHYRARALVHARAHQSYESAASVLGPTRPLSAGISLIYSRMQSRLFTRAFYAFTMNSHAFSRIYLLLHTLPLHTRCIRKLHAFYTHSTHFSGIYLWSAHASVCIAAYDCIHAPSMHAHACGRIHHSCMQTASRL